MMALRKGGLLWLAATAGVVGQTAITVDDPRTTQTATKGTGTTVAGTTTRTGTYLTLTSQASQDTDTLGSIPILSGSTMASNASQSRVSTDTATRTFLTGTGAPSGGNVSVTRTSSTLPTFTNTRPCNNYPEFCNRRYSNITEVGCHNSPFITPNNIAANQQYDVNYQLNDGVRFIQGQIQWPENAQVPHFCHTRCDILDAGPITDWLTQVKNWVATHPYDVVTILLGNGNFSTPDLYVPHIESTGILQYVYTPPLVPMMLDDWPTLGEMILSGKRVVMFMDYMADQAKYPWLLDEFSQLWETPFDPVDQKFPCVVQRPPDLPADAAKSRMYMMNHNLNIELSLLGNPLLAPARTELNVTNNVTGFGSAGLTGEQCIGDWGRPPNILNVDYYNIGGFKGSIFAAAAKLNNVTYDRPCCGPNASAASHPRAGFSGKFVFQWVTVVLTFFLVF